MIRINSVVTLEAGKAYEFTLVDGRKQRVIIRGSRASKSGDVFQIEVNGVQGDFVDLNSAIGGGYIHVSEV
jgi:hypothetical protein